jgi:broad specificity phosphatase PhoE
MSPKGSRLQVISLVRHADAGDRERFQGDDSLRPLSKRGRREAEAISQRFLDHEVDLVSSPFLRCMETLAPLSFRLRRAMSVLPTLAEGGDAVSALEELLTRLGSADELVACSHGDVMTGIVELAARRGALVTGPVNLEKASTTELTVRAGEISAMAFVAAPSR